MQGSNEQKFALYVGRVNNWEKKKKERKGRKRERGRKEEKSSRFFSARYYPTLECARCSQTAQGNLVNRGQLPPAAGGSSKLNFHPSVNPSIF